MDAAAGEGALTRLVRRARSAVRAARATESALVAASVFAGVLTLAVLSAARTPRAQELCVAALAALLAAATWWWPHRVDERAVAARLDRRLEQGGALRTAWEAETGRVPSTDVARLLASRVVARVPLGRAVRRVLPRGGHWTAAPFVAAALLALALDRVHQERDDSASARAVRALASGLADLTGVEGVDGAQLADLARRAEDLARDAGEPGEPADLEARARELERELAAVTAEAPPELRADLEERRVLADQARRALEEGTADPDAPAPGPAPGAPESPASNGGGSGLASGAEAGTMSGSPGGGAAPGAGPPAPVRDPGDAASAGAAGVLSRGRWWSARHDALVAAWVEARRATD